jgi:uncharacterized membrane protein
MSFLIILVGVLLSGSVFSVGFMQLVRKRRVLGFALMIIAAAIFISMFFVIKDAPPVQSVD